MQYKIVHLPKEQWQNKILPMEYLSEEYYDVSVAQGETGFAISLERKKWDEPVLHKPEEYGFPDRLYLEHWQGACAWGILKGGELIAAIETCPEEWSNRLRITELWVDIPYQKNGLGHSLIEIAKEQAVIEHRRAIILETQSCNGNAIGFYLHEGFTLIGLDTCCYGNNDLAQKEVRIEFGWFPKRKKEIPQSDIEIRPERPEEYRQVERMVQRAFWNKFKKGCDEHLLVHRLREADEYLPKLSRVAVKDGEIIGAIFYSRAYVQDGSSRQAVLCFGPLAVSPEWRGIGIGELLLRETMKLAADAGFPGIIIFGEPDYYPRVGFQTCEHFGITTKDGDNFDSFLGIELIPNGFQNIQGKFHYAPIFDTITPEETAAFDELFPPLQKQYFPSQW